MRRYACLLVGAAVGLAAWGQTPALPAAPAATVVTASGATATTVSATSAAVTKVTTATVSGSNAYNAFSAFQVAPATTVDLILPAGSSNLINLVSGSQTQIFGTLNSLDGSGNLAGNVFFADPEGIVIGRSGVVNVGSLTLATPTDDFVNSFFNDITDNTATLVAGTEPIVSGGLIQIAGAVNALGPVTLAGDVVDVAGAVTTGATPPAFAGMVNVQGLEAGEAISVTGSQITIDGGSGATAAELNAGAGTGDITLAASQSDSENEARAVAGVTIGYAALAGDNISLSATAAGTSTDTIGSDVKSLLDDGTFPWEITGNAAWNTAAADAEIQIGANGESATITAAGGLSLDAAATTSTTIAHVAQVGSFNYGETDATANTVVGANATLSAVGAVGLTSTVNNTLSINPKANSVSTPGVAVSYGKASSTSTASVAGTVTGGSVSISASNQNSFNTAANGVGASMGVGVALGSYASSATAAVTGTATATQADQGGPALQVAATSQNTSDEVNANSSINNGSNGSQAGTAANVASVATGVGFLSTLGDYLLNTKNTENPSPEGQPAPNAQSGASALGLGAAVSYLSSSNAADASVGGSGAAASGSISVSSTATDTPQISAAGTASSNATSLLLGGGLAYGEFSNTAATTVGGSLTAGAGVDLSSVATLPNTFTDTPFTALPGEFGGLDFTAPSSIGDGDAFSQDWDSGKSLAGDIVNILSPSNTSGLGQFIGLNLGVNHLLNSYVNTGATSSSGSSSGVGVAGSLNFLNLNNTATTTIAGGATVEAAAGDVDATADAEADLINLSGMGANIKQLAGLNPGAQGDAALGGSYNGVTLDNSATAAVDDGATVEATTGAVNVTGTGDEFLVDITQAGDNAGQFGVNGTFGWLTANDTALGYIQTDATVEAGGDVNVGASNTMSAYTIGGALGYGGSAQVGAVVNWNQITNTTEAYIGDPANGRTQASGSVSAQDVSVDATSQETLWAIGVAAEAATAQTQNGTGEPDETEGGDGDGPEGVTGQKSSYGLGASGNVAINDINDTTLALINNSAVVTAPGSVSVSAADTSFAVSAGLAAALTTGQDASADLAGAFARNNFSKDTEADVANATIADGEAGAAGSLGLSASNNGELITVSAGGGGSSGPSGTLAGAVNNNLVTNTTLAEVGSGGNVDVSGGVNIDAAQDDGVVSVTGVVADGGGLGSSLDLSSYSNTTEGSIGNGASVTAGGAVSLAAATNSQVVTVAASLELGGYLSVSGVATVDPMSNTTEALLGDATLQAGGALGLSADDASQMLQIAGSVGGGAIGVSGAISTQGDPLMDRTVEATVASGANAQAASVALGATMEGGEDTVVAGVGVSSLVGVAGSLALTYVDEDVLASIADGATVATTGSLGLNAQDSSQLLDAAGAMAGSGVDAAGAAADVQFVNRTVQAEVGGTVTAGGDITDAADLGGSDDSIAATAAASYMGDLAGAASAVFDTTTVEADVAEGATVTTPESMNVAASNAAAVTLVDGELGYTVGTPNGGGAGIGAAVAVLDESNSTLATIGAGAMVAALGQGAGVAALTSQDGSAAAGTVNGLAVTADGNESLLTIAVGGQASGLAVAGSLVLNQVSDTTSASVGTGAVINPAAGQSGASVAQGVDILANDGTTLTSGVGAVGLADGLGVGASVDLEGSAALPSEASAFANTVTQEENGVSGGNPGSLTGGFSKDTTAGVDNTAQVNAAGTLDIAALSSESITAYDASVALGADSVAGTVEVDDFDPTTTAYVGGCGTAEVCSNGATVSVGSASIEATDSFNFQAIVGELSAGGAALGAAVLDATVDGATSVEMGPDSSLTAADGVSLGSNFSDNFAAATLAGGAGTVTADVPYATITDKSGNNAIVGDGATVNSGSGGLSVSASTTRTIAGMSGAAVAGAIGAGATILDVDFEGSTGTTVGDGAQLTADGDLAIAASLNDIVPSDLPDDLGGLAFLDPGSVPTGVLGATVALAAGVGAQVTITDNGKDAVTVGDATLTGGDAVVSATNTLNLQANSLAGDAGVAAAGASIAVVNLGGATSASLGGTEMVNSLALSSNENETLDADAEGIGAGLAAGNGTVASIDDTSSNGVTQSGTTTGPQGVSIEALTNRTASVTSGSTNYGLLTVGVSVANVTLGGETTATLNGDVTAIVPPSGGTNLESEENPSLAVLEASDTDTATVNATVDAGGAVNGLGAIAGQANQDPSVIDPTVTTTVAAGGSLNGGPSISYGAPNVQVLAEDSSTLTSNANGGLSGAINVGVLNAEGEASPAVTTAIVGTVSGGEVYANNYSLQTVTSNTVSSESSSLANGYSTDAGAFADPTLTINVSGAIQASNYAWLYSGSTNEVSASANATAGSSVLAAGATDSNAGITNSNTITYSGTFQGDDISLEANSINQVPANTSTGGTGEYVLAGGASADATTTINDTTDIYVDAPLRALEVSLEINDTNQGYSTASDSSGLSGVALLFSNASTLINDQAAIDIASGVALSGDGIDINLYTTPGGESDATSTAGEGFNGDATADSNFTATVTPVINLDNGASLTGNLISVLNSVGIYSLAGSPQGNPYGGEGGGLWPYNLYGVSNATTSTNSLTGSATSNANDSVSLDPVINMVAGSTINIGSGGLTVEAVYNQNPSFYSNPVVTGVSTAQWVFEQTENITSEAVGWIPFFGPLIEDLISYSWNWVENATGNGASANRTGSYTPNATLNFSPTVNELASAGGAAVLTIDANGSVDPASSGMTVAGTEGDDILVNGAVSSDNPTLVQLQALNGTISGSPEFVSQAMPGTITITNNSNDTLILPTLQAPPFVTPPQQSNGAQTAGNFIVDIDAGTNGLGGFAPTLAQEQGNSQLSVINNGGGDVVLTGNLLLPLGSVTIDNLGGSILSSASGLISAIQISLSAPEGEIGSVAGEEYVCAICPGSSGGAITLEPMNLQPAFAAGAGTPQVSAASGGDMNLALNPYAFGVYQPTEVVDLGDVVAGGDLSLSLGYGETSLDSNSGVIATMDYVLGGGDLVAAGGNVDIALTGFNYPGLVQGEVDLIDNGLIASGFQAISESEAAGGAATAAYTFDGQTYTTAAGVNFPDVGAITSDGGNVTIAAHPAKPDSSTANSVSGSGKIGILNGPADISLDNEGSVNGLSVGPINDEAGGGTITVLGHVLDFGLVGGGVPVVPGTGIEGAIYSAPNGGAVTMTSASGLFTDGITTPGAVTLTGAEGVNTMGAAIDAGGAVNITSTGSKLELGAITTPDGITASGAAGMDVGAALSAGGGVTLGSNSGPITLGDITAGGNITINAATGINAEGGTETADGDVSMTTQSGDLDVTNVTFDANYTTSNPFAVLTSGGDVNLEAAAPPPGTIQAGANGSVNGTLTITAGGSVLDDGYIVMPVGTATISGAEGIEGDAVAQANTLTLQSSAGSIGSETPLPIQPGTGAFNASAADDIALMSFNAVNIGEISAGGNLSLVSQYGGFTSAGGPLNLQAGGNIDLDTSAGEWNIGAAGAPIIGSAGGSWTIRSIGSDYLDSQGAFSGSSITGDTVNLTVNDGSAGFSFLGANTANITLTQHGATLSIPDTEFVNVVNAIVPGNITLGSAANMNVGNLTAGGTITLQADGTITNSGSVLSGLLNAVATGGDVDLSVAGPLELGTVAASGNVNLTAPGGIGNGGATLTLSAVDITLNAGSGAAGSAGSRLTGTASGQWNVNAGGGIFLTSEGAFNASAVAAPGSNVQLTVNGGNATIGSLSANDADLMLTQHGDSLDVNAATITGVLLANADVMDFSQITNPSASVPVYLSLTGVGSGIAQTIDAVVASSAPVIVESYESQTGSVDVQGDWLLVERSLVGQSATFANSWESMAVANNKSTAGLIEADFVGSAAEASAPTMTITPTNLLPGQVFTVPSTLSASEQMLVTLLSRL